MMKILEVSALAVLLLFGAVSCTTTEEIKQILIKESISRYHGNCPCPDSVDQGGRRCGDRSAYSKPGGASPLCYPDDISDDMVKEYERRTE